MKARMSGPQGKHERGIIVPRRAVEPPRSAFGRNEAAKRRLSVESDVRTFRGLETISTRSAQWGLAATPAPISDSGHRPPFPAWLSPSKPSLFFELGDS